MTSTSAETATSWPRYQAGDPQAFDDLYRRYFGRLHRYCKRHTRDSHEAEEVAQEAFVKAFRAMHTLDGERRFYPWMTVIAKRITIDRHRKDARLELTDEPDLGSVEPEIDHIFTAVDADHVRQAMGSLGARHREVLELREARGMSYREIAEHLAVPVTTVEALLHRARKALRREFVAVSGESRGLWGLPVLGWLSTRLGGLRAKLGDRWVEIGMVTAPLAVGAVTAAVVLVPSPGADGPPQEIATKAATVTSVPADTVLVDPGAPVVVGAPDGAGTPPPAAAPPSVAAPATPDATVGEVDVFVGTDGTDRAREEAERMPTHTSFGPAAAGADARRGIAHAAEFLARSTDFLSGNPDDDTDAGDDSTEPQPLLGGHP